MPTIVDSLVVLLGLDSKQFTQANKQAQADIKKTGDVAEQNRKRHEEQAKKTAEAYNTVRESILGVTAAFVTAVAGGEFLSFLTKNDAAAGNLAPNIGATAREVSALEGVFRRMGSSTADAESFLRNINKIQEEIKLTGTSSALLPFAQAGLNIGAFQHANARQAMGLLADAAAKLDPRDAQFRLQAAGMSESQINIILRGKAAIDQMYESQLKINAISQKDYELALQRQTAWATLGETLEGVGRKIANTLTPALTFVVEKVQQFLQYVVQDGPTATAILAGLAGVMSTLFGYKIASWAAGMTGAFGAAGTAAGVFAGRLGMIVAAAAGLYEIIYLLDALAQLVGIKSRTGVTLSADTQARIAAGALNGSGDPFHSKSGSGGSTLGARNNNPGNLRFAGQMGGAPGAGGFASFGSVADGLAAMDTQLSLYGLRGNNTLAGIISTYAPAGDGNNVGAYIADVASKTGFSANQSLNMQDPATMRAVMSAMASHEGNPVDLASINAGMDLAQSRGRGVGTGGVNIGNLPVNTSASTMTGVGQDAGDAINQRYILAQQSAVGMQ